MAMGAAAAEQSVGRLDLGGFSRVASRSSCTAGWHACMHAWQIVVKGKRTKTGCVEATVPSRAERFCFTELTKSSDSNYKINNSWSTDKS